MRTAFRRLLGLGLLALPLACGGSTAFFVEGDTSWSIWSPQDCVDPECRHPRVIAVADVDGDGHQDIGAGGEGDGVLSILLGDGEGEFTLAAPVDVDVGERVDLMAAGFFDDDDLRDLAVVDADAGEIRVFLGAPKGRLTLAPGGPVALSGSGVARVLVAGRVDGDAQDDLILADDAGDVSVFLSAGDGSLAATDASPFFLAASIGDMALGDFDDEAGRDLLILDPGSGEVEILSGDDAGGFSRVHDPLTVGSSPVSVAVEFYDAGRDLDLAVLDAVDHTVHVFLGDGAGGFEAAPGSPLLTPTGTGLDLVPTSDAVAPNYPAHLIVLLSRTEGRVSIVRLLNQGDGTFTPAGEPRQIGGRTDTVHAAPLSEDGLSDLCWGDFVSGRVHAAFGQRDR